jgi:hypothetical protein
MFVARAGLDPLGLFYALSKKSGAGMYFNQFRGFRVNYHIVSDLVPGT